MSVTNAIFNDSVWSNTADFSSRDGKLKGIYHQVYISVYRYIRYILREKYIDTFDISEEISKDISNSYLWVPFYHLT